MISKSELLKCSITNFTKFGSKRFTLDELASTLGISKKTIYKYFPNKETLIAESLSSLLEKYDSDIEIIINENGDDPILSIILIYKRGFEYLKYFKPSFLYGIKKYYPKADAVFNDFSNDFVNTIVIELLKKAESKGHIKPNVDLSLIGTLYFLRIDQIAFKNNNLFDAYSDETLLNHLIVFNLRGIVTDGYSNSFFE
tara:strand:+ start:45409 stop:46002 length:594 start_codon:yes stop_codon:yes gene_type:complete